MATKITKIIKTDIAIVGGGPVGMMLSLFLKRYGINHYLIEKRIEPTLHPQAHFINGRTMEIIRSNFPSLYLKICNSSPSSLNWR